MYAVRARVGRFEQYYNDRLVGYTYSQYDGSFLKLSDLNPQVTLHKHQRDAIARILVSGNNILLAHNVGAGKTYIMISALHELYRMNISIESNRLTISSLIYNLLQTFKRSTAN